MTEERKADKLAGKGSVAGKLKEGRKYKESRLDEINRQMGIEPTRQRNRPQTGRSRMDEEGNQDTLE